MMIKPNRFTVMLAGLASLVLCMGLGRYAFTPMIPVMQSQIGLTESTAGWLAGWGYIGYLSGLFIVWLVSNTKAKDFFFRYGLVVTIIATGLMAANEHVLVWGLSRFFAGLSAAAGFLFGAGLIIDWLNKQGHPIRMGLYFCGLGLGIILSALTVEFLGEYLQLPYRWMWVAMAACGLLPLFMVLILLPIPKEEHEKAQAAKPQSSNRPTEIPSSRWLWLMQGAYFCAGFSNTMNATFTSLVAELQPLPGFGAKAWLIVGLAATPAPLVWEYIAQRVSYLDALIAAFLVNILGNIVLVTMPSLNGTIIAACLFGFSFMGIVSLTLATVGRRFKHNASQIMARLTLGYCVAQILSPVFSGIVAQKTGSFSIPIYTVVLMMAAGLVFLYLLRSEDVFRQGKNFFSANRESTAN